MRRRRLLTGGAALAAAASLQPALTDTAQAAPPPAAPLPSGAAVVAVLRRVADQWIGAHTDPGDDGWANATFFSGLLALQRLTGSPRYLAYARNWAEKHAYGLNGGVTSAMPTTTTPGRPTSTCTRSSRRRARSPPSRSRSTAWSTPISRTRTTTGGGTTPCTWRCLRSPGSGCSAATRGTGRSCTPSTTTPSVSRADPACTTPARGSGIGTSGSSPGSPAGSSRPRASRWSGRAATAGWRADTPRRSRRCRPPSDTPASTATPWYVW
ncbi:hypothetical protein SAMN05446589_0007 [Streptomyces sp. OV198]|nr:hypothetical protein SAMN05446589_0007 [Streptomyces sp. OV198]